MKFHAAVLALISAFLLLPACSSIKEATESFTSLAQTSQEGVEKATEILGEAQEIVGSIGGYVEKAQEWAAQADTDGDGTTSWQEGLAAAAGTIGLGWLVKRNSESGKSKAVLAEKVAALEAKAGAPTS